MNAENPRISRAGDATRAVKMAIRDASKSYSTRSGAVHALDSVSLDVSGEFLIGSGFTATRLGTSLNWHF